MDKKLRIVIIIISLAIITFITLDSFRSIRVTYLNDTQGDQCFALKIINMMILNDNEMLDYFSALNKDTLMFYKDTTISLGFHSFFLYDLALLRDIIDSNNIG
jgi:hypothetical protein